MKVITEMTCQFLDQPTGQRSQAFSGSFESLESQLSNFLIALRDRMMEEAGIEYVDDAFMDKVLERFNSQLVIVLLEKSGDEVALSQKPILTVPNFQTALQHAANQQGALS
jgi:hypothetical protein